MLHRVDATSRMRQCGIPLNTRERAGLSGIMQGIDFHYHS
jgi:hypothetical protein